MSKLLQTVAICVAAMAICGSLASAGSPQKTKAKENRPMVLMETSEGTIKIELWADKAPITVKNFLQYVDEKFYDGTIYHRVIPSFMIQGGGMSADMREKSNHAPIKNEATAELKNERGTLAMARTSVIDSATSQFFINLVDNSFLNHTSKTPQGFGYAVFGKVVEGMDVVDKIAAVKTGNKGMHQNVPTTPVLIKSVRRISAE
jgi:peptidyl-prolyl cis-trans isomerase B (cyclophilin B)